MKPYFYDLLKDRPEPLWWDWRGVPRWEPWHPGNGLDELGATEHALVVIHCQWCGKVYIVDAWNDPSVYPNLAEAFKTASWHYGDPPFGDCCSVGYSMNAVPRKVLRYFRLPHFTAMLWKRDPSLEIDIVPEWARDKYLFPELDYDEILRKVLHPDLLDVKADNA
ncbi:hypothetical protein P74p15 [Thermus phage P74-26]|uniref:Uncharacterized protein n=1 Tax=Thermus phage P74-26 TaxID=2914007 RepID=A7XXH8_BP742|nr:hypothetical protein P74p15 [Thermus phage P74-26]ABU96965.1 conserved hypothetical protein [Thermus phage P74-26]